MRWIFWLVIVLAVGGVSAPASAEMDDDTRGDFVRKAWGCGGLFQSITALQIRESFPDFKRRFLAIAKSRGADDWEIEVLDVTFEAGAIDTIKSDIYPGVGDITSDNQEDAKKQFGEYVHNCLGDDWENYVK